MILQRWQLFANDMAYGTENYIAIFQKHFPLRTVHGV